MEPLAACFAIALAAWVTLVIPVGVLIGRAIGRGTAVIEHRAPDPFEEPVAAAGPAAS